MELERIRLQRIGKYYRATHDWEAKSESEVALVAGFLMPETDDERMDRLRPLRRREANFP